MRVPMLPIRFLQRTAQLYPEKEAIVCGGEGHTYRQFHARVNQLSHALKGMGVEPGDRVAYLALNCHRLLEGYYGVPQIGAILVCINVRLTPQEVAFILNDAQPKVLVLSQMLAPMWEAIEKYCPSVQQVLVMEGALPGRAWPGYDDTIAGEPTGTPAVPTIDEDDVAEIFYTSGTTGNPKGVMLTYRNLYAHALACIIGFQFTDETVQVVGTVPLFHVNAWGAPHFLVAVGGSQIVVPRFDPATVSEAVERHHATHVLLVPTMLTAWLNYTDLDRYDLSSLRMVILGGAPAPYSLIEQARRRFDCECLVGYGMTETSPIVSVGHIKTTLRNRPQEERDRRQAMAGLPMIGVEVEIFDPEGQLVPHDGTSPGEVGVRGDMVMKGYWNRPEETQQAFRDGWYMTGDMATIDSEGYLNIVDRKKDIIISGGENIAAAEIENVLYQHPAVLEAAVIAVPDPKWGETPKAIVALQDDHPVSEQDLLSFCRQHLAGFKVPRSVEFVAELPKTGTGKIVKHQLRAKFWEGQERKVH